MEENKIGNREKGGREKEKREVRVEKKHGSE